MERYVFIAWFFQNAFLGGMNIYYALNGTLNGKKCIRKTIDMILKIYQSIYQLIYQLISIKK